MISIYKLNLYNYYIYTTLLFKMNYVFIKFFIIFYLHMLENNILLLLKIVLNIK